MKNGNKVVLIILDGWGHGNKSRSDAIHHANTPFISNLYNNYPNAELLTDGGNVGLPDGQMGNSEVGHLNIGAGRIVYQDLVKINRAIEDNSFKKNPVLLEAFHHAKESSVAVHLMGLVSDGGIHSHINHLMALCDMTHEAGLKNVFVHAFTDGRDTDPGSGAGFISRLLQHLEKTNVTLATICGRYYAMDRDNRWERIVRAHNMLTKRQGIFTKDAVKAINESYKRGVTDEFIEPVVLTKEGIYIEPICEGDVVVCFNFRTDRCRQLTRAMTQEDYPKNGMKKMPLHFVTMTNYDKNFKNVFSVFDKDNLDLTLGEVLAGSGKKQIRISETEKYPHVTYFFSGGRETPFAGEKRILIPSPTVATYDLKPEMSAWEVTEAIVTEIEKGEADFICLNFANPDMVGHTGVYDAVIKAVETVDKCTERVINAGIKNGYNFIIIADHGNADCVINPDGTPNTAHTTNPVPCFIIDPSVKKVRNGILADVAPTILKMMGMKIPDVMTGNVLV